MALDFPNSPTVGAQYTSGGTTWQWDGTKWIGIAPPPPISSDAPSDGKLYGRLNATWTVGVKLAGDTMSGDLAIAKTTPILVLNKTAAGDFDIIQGQTGGVLRWSLIPGDSTAESGSNAGSNFVINRYNDAGTILGPALSITRSTGLATVTGDPTAALGIATKQYVDAHSGFVNLSNQTASSSAALTFAPLPTGYRRFKIISENIRCASTAQSLLLQVSEDGGSTWKTTGSYVNQATYSQGTGTASMVGGTTDLGVRPCIGLDLNVSASEVEITWPYSVPSGQATVFSHKASVYGSALLYEVDGGGYWNGDTGQITAVRLIFTGAALIASGNASLYGIV